MRWVCPNTHAKRYCKRLPTGPTCAANLYGADLSGANLVQAFLIGADLSRANLNSANLSNANLSGAKYNKDTKWPKKGVTGDGMFDPIFDPVAEGAKLVEDDD